MTSRDTRRRIAVLAAALLLAILVGLIVHWLTSSRVALLPESPELANSYETRDLRTSAPVQMPPRLPEVTELPAAIETASPAADTQQQPSSNAAPDAHTEPKGFRATVAGRVVDEQGNGVPYAEVRADYTVHDPSARRSGEYLMVGERNTVIRADAAGNFTYAMDSDQTGEGFIATVAHVALPVAGHARSEQEIIARIANGEHRADVVLVSPAAGTASGRVVDPAGRPVAGAFVEARSPGETPGRERGTYGRTNSSGAYKLESLNPGRWEIFVGWSMDSKREAQEVFIVKAGSETTVPDLTAPYETRVSVRVLNEHGLPLKAGTHVGLLFSRRDRGIRPATVVDDEGLAYHDRVDAASNELRVQVKGYKDKVVKISLIENEQNRLPDIWLEPKPEE